MSEDRTMKPGETYRLSRSHTVTQYDGYHQHSFYYRGELDEVERHDGWFVKPRSRKEAFAPLPEPEPVATVTPEDAVRQLYALNPYDRDKDPGAWACWRSTARQMHGVTHDDLEDN